MKTIRKWLEELPDGYRELALENHVEGWSKGQVATSVWHALVLSFEWSTSKQGQDYWENLVALLASQSTESMPEPTEDHPLCKINYSASNDVWVEVSESELRDRFALAAMQGWLSSLGPNDIHPVSSDSHRALAQQSYTLAQAMVEARKEYVKR